MSIVLTGSETVVLTPDSDIELLVNVKYTDERGGVATGHEHDFVVAGANDFTIVPTPPQGATRTVTSISVANQQPAGQNAVVITAAGSQEFSGTLQAGEQVTFNGSTFTHVTSAGDGHSGGGNGGSSSVLVDLGVVEAADLCAGPVTLFTPAEGVLVQGVLDKASFVSFGTRIGQGVHVAFSTYIRALPDVDGDAVLHDLVNVVATTSTGQNTAFEEGDLFWGFADGSAVKAVLVTDISAFAILSTPAAWQANHAYADNSIILDPNGHWQTTCPDTGGAGGTSGATIPDFSAAYAVNNAGTTVDGTATWVDEGPQPDAGSIHAYALVYST